MRTSILAFLFLPLLIQAQTLLTPRVTTYYHRIGSTRVPIQLIQYGDVKNPVYINLHDDEATAVIGTKRLLQTRGGLLIRLENAGRRNMRFQLSGRTYTFDPNRIFSRKGIAQTLKLYGRSSPAAIAELEGFAARILSLIPTSTSTLVALHNNSNGQFSVNSFLPGKERATDAKKVHAVPGQDEDDVFLTTDSTLYHQLIKENFNVIWQDNRRVNRDGSLSVYCGENNICYLNCETEHDKVSQYESMITAASRYLYPAIQTAITRRYRFQLETTRTNEQLKGLDIFFGDRMVGRIVELDTSTVTNTRRGTMELLPDFPLFDNMAFHLRALSEDKLRVELSIDPTRQRSRLDPDRDIVSIGMGH